MMEKKQKKTKKMAKRHTTKGFRIHGIVQELESGQGMPELIVEALDKDLIYDDRLGSAITDAEGRFELRYEKEDFQELIALGAALRAKGIKIEDETTVIGQMYSALMTEMSNSLKRRNNAQSRRVKSYQRSVIWY